MPPNLPQVRDSPPADLPGPQGPPCLKTCLSTCPRARALADPGKMARCRSQVGKKTLAKRMATRGSKFTHDERQKSLPSHPSLGEARGHLPTTGYRCVISKAGGWHHWPTTFHLVSESPVCPWCSSQTWQSTRLLLQEDGHTRPPATWLLLQKENESQPSLKNNKADFHRGDDCDRSKAPYNGVLQ